ncbi:MAG TPA: fused MFS/spermidine synthase [Planctomycetota bacterium]
MRAALYGFFFLSGAAGLLYEVAWIRQAGTVIGNTTYAVGTVVGVYMAGLALGAWIGGRLADRRGGASLLRLYGALEAGVAISALLVGPVFGLSEPLFRGLWRALGESSPLYLALRVLLVGLALAAPTTLMGATLPVLAKFFSTSSATAPREAGRIYAVNTLGGVLGTLAAGFWLVPALGLRATSFLAAALNVAIGVASVAMARGKGGDVLPSLPEGAPPRRSALVVAALSGFAALVLEVAWTRSLTIAMGSTVHAFTIILAAFILGLALGSALSAWIRVPLAALQAGIGVAAVLLIPFLGDLPLSFAPRMGEDPLARQAGLAAIFVLGPSILMGAVFPRVIELAGGDAVGRSVAAVYTANTLGCIAGSLAGSFLLVPLLGVSNAIKAAATISLALAAALLPRRWIAAPVVAVLLAWAVVPRWNTKVLASGAFLYGSADERGARAQELDLRSYLERDTELLAEHWDAYGLVTVHRQRSGILTMRVNGKADASTGPGDRPNMLFTGHLPLLHHPAPKRALLLGLGGGITLEAMRRHPLERIDCVEISPAVVRGAEQFKEAVESLKDPRVRLVVGDGRSLIAFGTEPLDVIVSQPSNLWVSGMAGLFTRDFFRQAAARLGENGVFGQWIHAYRLAPDDFKLVLRTFFDVFPRGSLWEVFPGSDYILIGGGTSMRDSDLFRAPGHRICDAEGARRIAGPGGTLTDDRCAIEYTAPRALYRDLRPELLELIEAAREPSPRQAIARAVKLLSERKPLQALAALPGDVDDRTKVFADQAAEGAIDIGVSRLDRGDLPGAVTALSAVPLYSSLYAEARVELGGLALTARDVDLAERRFTEARRADERSFGASVGLAQCAEIRKDLERAWAYWRESVDIRPESVPARFKLADVLAKLGRAGEAKAACLKVLELQPGHPDAAELLRRLVTK